MTEAEFEEIKARMFANAANGDMSLLVEEVEALRRVVHDMLEESNAYHAGVERGNREAVAAIETEIAKRKGHAANHGGVEHLPDYDLGLHDGLVHARGIIDALHAAWAKA